MKDHTNSKIPRLFEIMNEKGIKGSDLTRDLKIPSGTISCWKVGRNTPNSATYKLLADYLGTTPEYLLGETDIKEKTSERTEDEELVSEFADLINGLTDEQLKSVFDYIEFIKGRE